MTKFEGGTNTLRQAGQEVLQPLSVFFRIGRKLKQNHTESFTEKRRGIQQIFRFLGAVLQPLNMGDALGCFDRKAKTGRHMVPPILDHARLRQAIEGVVNFHREKTTRVIRKHFLRRQIFRIEVPLPFFVTVPTGADVKLHLSNVENKIRIKQLLTTLAQSHEEDQRIENSWQDRGSLHLRYQ